MSYKQQQRSMLVIEDSDEDFESIQWAFKKSGVVLAINRCTSGEEGLDFLYRAGKYTDPDMSPRPSLIWLDLNLPSTNGREVLERIKQDADLKVIPLLIVTTSASHNDIKECYQQGANSYILKPLSLDRLVEIVKQVDSFWFGTAVHLEQSY